MLKSEFKKTPNRLIWEYDSDISMIFVQSVKDVTNETQRYKTLLLSILRPISGRTRQ